MNRKFYVFVLVNLILLEFVFMAGEWLVDVSVSALLIPNTELCDIRGCGSDPVFSYHFALLLQQTAFLGLSALLVVVLYYSNR